MLKAIIEGIANIVLDLFWRRCSEDRGGGNIILCQLTGVPASFDLIEVDFQKASFHAERLSDNRNSRRVLTAMCGVATQSVA